MLAQALSAFELDLDFDMQLMQPGQSLPELTGRVINAVTGFINENSPDAILVQGDTTTVLAGAMAAAMAKVPIGHVEAGLRTYDMNHPFPEEMNRRLVSPLAKWHFVPTEESRQNLLSERIDPSTIHVTGNSVIDSLLWMREKVAARTESSVDSAARLGMSKEFASKYFGEHASAKSARYVLVTGHRRESFGGGFEDICHALNELAKRYPDVGILYPVHLNPQVREPVNRLLSDNPRICLIEPAGYEDFVWLMDRCHFLLSDSGGVQEEAPSLGKPVLVMRETTERPEGVTAGTCRLVGTDRDKIVREASLLLDDPAEYQLRSQLKNPYGDGNTAQRICEILERDLCS
ncbi:MAG: UDP-N-acetylglucosamine 2-epimerase (non-hydrolyzing) [Aureliella sp.]